MRGNFSLGVFASPRRREKFLRAVTARAEPPDGRGSVPARNHKAEVHTGVARFHSFPFIGGVFPKILRAVIC
ncbi:hypothetical protein JS73_08420 [Synergistes jonesii]|uniref:Uncharacterized protein n=1 Tax=Synergistes jonesii TaxID=2754 RepID=A0A073IR97_9BACT|nr:hypothetical protein EH55_06305 [Synergistes jonesii]OFB61944.1 hypothetical protein JS73_08420 [Synergistes jonesii]OFB62550.1 hypothetical protein JS79_08890 [Synergistes jonesii]OFB64238.1 hypothetical protein JS72_04700 [Synergistes jonesii]OFB67385.1 hypothetical protein JS78_08430 [Synergistes jonesii]